MNSPFGLAHVVIVGHSGIWRKNVRSDFHNSITKIMIKAEKQLRERFPTISIRPEFFPPEKAFLADEIIATANECSFAILDITDSDENLAFLAGALAAKGVRTLLFADNENESKSGVWPFEEIPVEYRTFADLESNVELVCTELGNVLESTPVTSRLIHSLWFPRDVSSIWVVCPQIHEPGEFAQPSSPDYTYLDNLGDTDSLLEVMVFLSRYYPKASIEKFSSRDLPIGLTKGNLVVIGGPGTQDTIHNELTRSMMEAQHSRLSYSEDCESLIIRNHGADDLELKSKVSTQAGASTDQLVADFGYFAGFRNPANESNRVICINGIHTIGVLGAARAFGDSREALRNYGTVLAKVHGTPEFECCFEVNVVNREIRVPRIEPAHVFRFGVSSAQQAKDVAESTRIEKTPVHDGASSDAQEESSDRMLQENRSRLKVVNVLARQIVKTHGKVFEGCSGIFLLHALDDLPPFLEAFESLGLCPPESIFYYKRYPYLNKEATLRWLSERGYQVEKMEELEKTLPGFLQRIDSSRRIFILEDGGYVGPFLHQFSDTPWSQIVGAVEQTERGVRMYERIPGLRFPVAPVARCGLKNRQEPPHIGRSIVANIQHLLSKQNLAGKRCLVIGYGRIGEEVCSAARAAGMNVSVFDSDHGALAKAAQDSYNTRGDLPALLADTQIVIGTTGNQSLQQEHILSLPHNAILVSGSSGQYEIGLDALDALSSVQRPVSIGTEYTLEKENRTILLLGNGYPINFVSGQSVPDEAIDPVLGALLVASIAMIQKPPNTNGIEIEWTNEVMARFELEKLYYGLYFSR